MNKNIENRFAKVFGKMYDEALEKAQEYDDCRYCHEPFLSLGLAKNIDSEAIVYLNVLRESNVIKFCPVCGRDLSVDSYVDRMYQARKDAGEAMKKVDGLLKAKK